MKNKMVAAILVCLVAVFALTACGESTPREGSGTKIKYWAKCPELDAYIEGGELRLPELISSLGWTPVPDDWDYGAQSPDGRSHLWLEDDGTGEGCYGVLELVLYDGRRLSVRCGTGSDKLYVPAADMVTVPYAVATTFVQTIKCANEEGVDRAYEELESAEGARELVRTVNSALVAMPLTAAALAVFVSQLTIVSEAICGFIRR